MSSPPTRQHAHHLPRQMLQRAANVLAVPAIADSDVYLAVDHPSVTRRQSEGNASLGFVRRKIDKVKAISRARSLKRTPSKDSRASDSSTTVDDSSTSASKRQRHFRSYSDAVSGWTRPRVPVLDPTPITDAMPDAHIQQSPTRKFSMDDQFSVPPLLQQGVPMLKVSAKKQKQYIFRLDPDQGQIIWQSQKTRIIPIENIKELRAGADARYYRQQFQLSQEYEHRWLTIVYVLDGGYKTLHLIATTRDIFQMWDITLRKLFDLRKQLMSGLGHHHMRQALWEKQFWKAADEGADQKLDLADVERMCRRLNINPSKEDMLRRFKAADSRNRGYLDFDDFRTFVKALKARPELDRLYKKLVAGAPGLSYPAFARFMRDSQKSSLSDAELQRIFARHATPAPPQPLDPSPTPSPSPPTAPSPSPSAIDTSTACLTTHMSLKGFTSFLLSADNSAFADQHGKIVHDMTRPLPEYYISSSHNTYLVGHQLVGESTVEGYIRALLHSCRSVEIDIYDGDAEPTIYHGRTLTSKVSLRDTCEAIAKYAFVASPYPVVISAEVHCSLAQQGMVASIMREVFGAALVCAPVDGRPRIERLPSPEELKGRVLLKAKNLYVSEGEGMQEKEISVDTESSSTDTSASDSDEARRARSPEVIKDLKSGFERARDALSRRASSVHSPRRHSSSSSSRTLVGSPPAPSLSSTLSPTPTPTPTLTTTTPTPTPTLTTPPTPTTSPPKVKMSAALASLLVYTIGVKCRGLNKKEHYAPEHVFSLSENTANRIMKQGRVGGASGVGASVAGAGKGGAGGGGGAGKGAGAGGGGGGGGGGGMMDLIKHCRAHLVRVYPKGSRIGSTNYEPHRYWSAGAQLVAINWQTFDLGYVINHAMFQRNGRAGYVLKPLALRTADKTLLAKRTKHFLDVTVISAQQLPRQKDALGREIVDKSVLDPFVEVSVHVPDWTQPPFPPPTPTSPSPSTAPPTTAHYSPPTTTTGATGSTSARTVTVKTCVVKNNGFNPVWEQTVSLPFECVGDMRDLVFVRFAVKQEEREDEEPLAVYCTSLGSLNLGYRHLPLHDAQLSQYLFSTLFVNIQIRDA